MVEKSELDSLKALQKKKTPNLVVVKGRRRVGKSRLINFFASSCPKNRLWDFAGLATEKGMNDQSQRDHFARQLATHLKLAPFTFQDWTDAFEQIACEHSQKIFYQLYGKQLSLFAHPKWFNNLWIGYITRNFRI